MAAACAAPQIAITAIAQGRLDLGPNRKLVLFAGTGPKELRDELTRELSEQIRKAGYFAVTDRSRDGAPPKLSGGHVEWAVDDPLLDDDATGLRLDVSEQEKPCSSPAASALSAPCDAPLVVVVVASAFDKSGRILLKEHRFSAESPSRAEGRRAVAAVVADLLKAVTPIEVTHYALLDDRDSRQKRILAAAAAGDIGRAREELRYYLEQDPENAAAVYNLAVLTEAMSGCSEALHLYDRALALDNDPRYAQTRAACVTPAR
jgi:hypothetical protein